MNILRRLSAVAIFSLAFSFLSLSQPLFSPGRLEIPFEKPPGFLTSGDYDGNGFADIVGANSDGELFISLRQSSETYVTRKLYSFGTVSGDFRLYTADANGDQRSDVIVCSNDDRKIVSFLSDGSGGFSDTVTTDLSGFIPTRNSLTVGEADFNKDGSADLALVGYSGSPCVIYVLIGDGTGLFNLLNSIPCPFSVGLYNTIGDFNEDGALDLALTMPTAGADSTVIFFGNWQWNFTQGPAFSLGTSFTPTSVHAVDVNGDQHLDIVASFSGNLFASLLGDGTGNFLPPKQTIPGETVLYFSVGDFNEDSFPDVVIAGQRHGTGIMDGVGDGTFLSPRWYCAGIIFGIPCVADLNNDTHQDVFLASPFGISLMYGSGNGSLRIAPEYNSGLGICRSGSQNKSSIAAADFNGDSFVDLAAANPCGSQVSVLFGTGTGGFSGSPLILQVPGKPWAVAAADMNGDGFADIVVSDSATGSLLTFLGDGAGSFGIPRTYPLGEPVGDFVVRDFNKDGRPDVAVLSRESRSVFILRGDGTGLFSDSARVVVADSVLSIACDDFNEDGNPDLAVGLFWSMPDHTIALLQGDAQGRFTVTRYIGAGTILASAIVSSDFNEDGHKDLALCGITGEVYLGDGTGGMTLAPESPDFWETYIANSLLAIDVNADSHTDIVMGLSLLEGSVGVFLGGGSGTFTLSSYRYGLSGELGGLCASDFNGDGATDLAAAHPDTGIVSVLLGLKAVEHNVGILSIEAPPANVQLGSAAVPQVKVGNFGRSAETFQVKCEIDTSYQDQQDVSLSPGDQTSVSFKQWVPAKAGVYVLTSTAVLSSDQNMSNNTMQRSITVVGTNLAVYSITPGAGGNTGWVTATIHGARLQEGAVARLKREGMTDIVGDSAAFQATRVLTPATMQAVFNLTGAAEGYWDLEVTNPGQDRVLLENAFLVEKGKQLLWMDVAGASSIVLRQPAMFNLLVGNCGNVNVNYIVPMLSVPDVVDLDSITSEKGHRVLLYGDSLRAHGKKPSRVPFFIRNLSPGEITIFHLYVRGNTLTPSSPPAGGTAPARITELPAFSWSGLILSGVECLAKNAVKTELNPEATEEDWLDAVVDAVISFGEGLVVEIFKRGIEIAFPVTIPFIEAYELADAVMTAAQDVGQFFGFGNASKAFRIVGAKDPNQKIGPSGYGEEGYIVGDRPLSYQIHFENIDTATAPAHDIYVSDTLDADLDITTLTMGQTSHPPTGLTVDSTQGIIRWTFEGIDLPPNKHPPEGEGWMTYTITPKKNLPSGTQITNRASIVFDLNDPILTPTVLNTLDLLAPSSAVQTLDGQQNQVAFTLSWAGSDNESGVYWYQVYAAEDNGSYQLWTQTPKTSGVFIGRNGRSYRFYAVAVDNVGNVEAAPLSPDATTLLAAEEDIGFSPNPYVPSRGHHGITLFGGGLAYAEVKIFDKAGRLVRTLHERDGSSTLEWDATNDDGEKLASGVYIWVLSGPGGSSHGKFGIIR